MLDSTTIDALEEKFGLVWVSGDGSEVYVKCPFCPKLFGSEDRKGHLALNLTKNLGHCVRCDAGVGDVRKWLKNRYSYNIYGFSVPSIKTMEDMLKAKKHEKPVEKSQIVPLPDGTKPLPYHKWGRGPFSSSLVKKNITAEDAENYLVGYCNKEGRYGNYVIFPFIEDYSPSLEDAAIVYWQGRAIFPDMPYRKINPSKKLVKLGKSHWLYGYHLVEEGGVIYITEGNLDCISTNRFLEKTYGSGHYAVSIQGTALSFPSEGDALFNSQFGKILTKHPERVVVLLDPDAKKKAEALGNLLTLCGMNVTIGLLPNNDPNASSDADMLQALSPLGKLDSLSLQLDSLPKF